MRKLFTQDQLNKLGHLRKCKVAPRQHFFAKDGDNRKIEDCNVSVGGMFMTAQEAKDDPNIGPLHGRQNKRRGTLAKRRRKIAQVSRRANRA